MPHKHSKAKLQERKILRIIRRGSFYDRNRCELVSTITRIEVMAQLKEPVEVYLIPDVEKGEVLLDQQGKGSLQREDI